jgi:hypothetical protein
MAGIIVISQNEAATVSNDSGTSLCTIGLMGCIGVVLRGPLGFTLIHVDSHTDLNFINREMERLGSGATIQLFKWSAGKGELTHKIIEHLKSAGIKYDRRDIIELEVLKLNENTTAPFGVLVVDANGQIKPSIETYCALCTGAEQEDIDCGPQDFQMRSYKQQIFSYLNPDESRAPCVIYDNDHWNDARELSKPELQLLSYLLKVASNYDELHKRIMSLLKSEKPGYKERFAKEYLRYLNGSPHGRNVYDNVFPALLKRVYDYTQRTGLSLELPTPKEDRKPSQKRRPQILQ